MAKRKSRGKSLLVLFIMFLLLVALCLLGGIAATIPARTAQLFGPPAPGLSTPKLYQQSLVLLLSKNNLFETDNLPEGETRFPIEPGDSLDKILSGLTHLGLVRHTSELRAYLIYSGIDTRIQPGEFLISPGLSELEVAQMLGGPATSLTTVSILAGWRAEEVAASFPKLGLDLSPTEFLQSVQNENKEGYLFPGN
jgi:cell division protein YceG involved in septum cleavage